jgi:hypothetical protein
MAVSVRARLPVPRACRKSWLSEDRAVPSCWATDQALRTCPRISCSPSTADSSPAATENRWATAAVVVLAVEMGLQVSGAKWARPHRKSRMSAKAGVKRSATA